MDVRLVVFLVIISLFSITVFGDEEPKGTRQATQNMPALNDGTLKNTHTHQRRRRQIGWAVSNYAMPYVANSMYNYNPYTGSAMSSVSNNYLGVPYYVNAYTGYGPFGIPYAFNQAGFGK